MYFRGIGIVHSLKLLLNYSCSDKYWHGKKEVEGKIQVVILLINHLMELGNF